MQITQLLRLTIACFSLIAMVVTLNAEKKPWTFLVFMARDNSLFDAGTYNINELKAINNPLVNILIFDCHKIHGKKQAQKIIISHGKATIVETIPNVDSGKPATFLQAVLWAVKDFPSDKLAIVAWDHGSGMLNRNKIITRGFCYDDTTGSYLTDMSIRPVLDTIVKERGKKIDIFGFDACLMADIEMIAALACHANTIVASQETIPDDGWNYKELLSWETDTDLTPHQLAIKIVDTYHHYYTQKGESYTLSAINTAFWQGLNTHLNTLAQQLRQLSSSQHGHSLITKSVNHYFEEPTYMDMAQFCIKLAIAIPTLGLHKEENQKLYNTLINMLKSIQSTIIANVASGDHKEATGLSIYFPQKFIEPSYAKTYFAKNSAWLPFISYYIKK